MNEFNPARRRLLQGAIVAGIGAVAAPLFREDLLAQEEIPLYSDLMPAEVIVESPKRAANTSHTYLPQISGEQQESEVATQWEWHIQQSLKELGVAVGDVEVDPTLTEQTEPITFLEGFEASLELFMEAQQQSGVPLAKDRAERLVLESTPPNVPFARTSHNYSEVPGEEPVLEMIRAEFPKISSFEYPPEGGVGMIANEVAHIVLPNAAIPMEVRDRVPEKREGHYSGESLNEGTSNVLHYGLLQEAERFGLPIEDLKVALEEETMKYYTEYANFTTLGNGQLPSGIPREFIPHLDAAKMLNPDMRMWGVMTEAIGSKWLRELLHSGVSLSRALAAHTFIAEGWEEDMSSHVQPVYNQMVAQGYFATHETPSMKPGDIETIVVPRRYPENQGFISPNGTRYDQGYKALVATVAIQGNQYHDPLVIRTIGKNPQAGARVMLPSGETKTVPIPSQVWVYDDGANIELFFPQESVVVNGKVYQITDPEVSILFLHDVPNPFYRPGGPDELIRLKREFQFAPKIPPFAEYEGSLPPMQVP